MLSILKREIQSYFFSPFAFAICAVFLLVFSIVFIPGIANLSNTNVYIFSFPSVIYKNFSFFIFLIPALTMRTFAEERKSQTEVLLLTNPLDSFQIVIGKFLGVAAVYLLMLITSLIYPIVTLLQGHIYWSSLICCYIGFFAWGLVCITIGMLMSALTNSPVIAAILGEIAMIFLIFTDSLAESLKYSFMPVVSDILTWASTQSRFKLFAQGVFTLSDMIFYVSMMFVFLSWTVIALERRKWKS
ncbi:gliding motility-associated ABC transporter permease subunit GldF [Clostridia bacterium]|nr:gliding motility-associated ABC transporter permease subunit GldF [Clostridia bacterium]